VPSDTTNGRSSEHHKFRGWVPTVSGELSFSSFGISVTPTPAITANVSDRKSRYIICYQARDSSDVILPFKSFLEKYFLKLDGKMWFVCLAKTGEFESKKREIFKGHLFVYHNEDL
jgi:hypothetical protein